MEAKYTYLQDEQFPQKAEVQINDGKLLSIPFYGSIIRTNIDLQCFKEAVNSQQLRNTQVIMYGLGDAEAFKGKKEKTLFEFTGEKLDYKPLSQFITLIDPTAEYWISAPEVQTKKLEKIKDLPESIRRILKKSGSERAMEIKKTFREDSKITAIVEWYLKKQILLGAEIGLPPCIPIKGKNSFEYAIKINRIATTIQQDNGWQKCLYFAIDFKSFANQGLIDIILKVIYSLKPKFCAFKIFDSENFYKTESIIERANLDKFLEGLKWYKHDEGAVAFTINTDAIGCHLLGQQLGGFIEPISGNYKPDMMRRKKSVNLDDDDTKDPYLHFGKYPDPLKLDEKKFEVLEKLSKNTKVPFPCDCFECSKYEKLPKDKALFNKIRRRHRIFIRDRFIGELLESIKSRNLRASLFDRFSENNSKLKLFKGSYE